MSSGSNSDFYIKIAYFSSLAGASILFGFSSTLNKLRKNNPETSEAALFEEGTALARKALMRGTLYSVCGFSLFALASYKLFGKDLIANFNAKSRKNDDKDMEYLQNLLGASRSDLVGSSDTSKDTNKTKLPET